MDLIDAVMASTTEVEAPKRFYYWSTMAAISAVLRDKVWFNMGSGGEATDPYYQVFPNIYVLLYGPSGARKGPPINLARKLVSGVNNTKIISGRSSIEAIIQELGMFSTQPGKAPEIDSCVFLVASELSSSIIGNNAAMDIMTDLYDRAHNDGNWDYKLKNAASANLKKPTITWLAGTNEHMFNDFIPEKNLKGGLVGRTFVINEQERNTYNSLMFKTISPKISELTSLLLRAASLRGEFTMDLPARKFIDDWYNEFSRKEAFKVNDDTGFISRVGDYVVKVAMLISSGRRADKNINKQDTIESLEVVAPLILQNKKVISHSKKDDRSIIRKRFLVLNYLANQPECKAEKGQMLRRLGLEVSRKDLDDIGELLIDANALVIENQAGIQMYRLKVENPIIREWIIEFRSGNK